MNMVNATMYGLAVGWWRLQMRAACAKACTAYPVRHCGVVLVHLDRQQLRMSPMCDAAHAKDWKREITFNLAPFLRALQRGHVIARLVSCESIQH